jgi:4-hydroxyphenylpyruvate dioxygenase
MRLALRTPEIATMATDDFPLRKIDHVRFFVGNARQAALFYRNSFGFEIVGYAGLETKVKHESAYVLRQGTITFVLVSSLTNDHPDNYRLSKHGDGVMDIAIEVDNVRESYRKALERGAKGLKPPQALEDETGVYECASIHTYGDTLHSFINRDRYRGIFAPGYQPIEQARYGETKAMPTGLMAIDHMVGNVELGKMNEWVNFYSKVLGFNLLATFDDKDISTEYSALMSKVVQNGTGRIKFPINEPAQGKRKSQIDEYLEFYGGPGVQHIALATGNIIQTVAALRDNDVSFLRVPQTYYDALPDRVGTIQEDIKTLSKLGILVDRDDEGYMLQIFTKPVSDRPTLFFEIIQRRGSKSFGKGNFKALFESIEREQALRGTL